MSNGGYKRCNKNAYKNSKLANKKKQITKKLPK